ncbi:MAG TPA: cation diffusion facilitator family transporter [Candidatus Acidoferrum sp.]|nr:cation diffusion facilitator family transporter [Candidatus Acidoferrum sp.]
MPSPTDNHDHGPHAYAASDQRRLLIVLGVTSLYFITELVGGYLTGSLALLSDAVHMLTDIAALCLGLLTLWISARPASSAKTYGYLRAEILGALLNGLFLWVLVVFIWIEAFGRLRNPRPVSGLAVMVIALVGIGVNTFSAWMTSTESHGGHQHGMAMRSVFVHVISDLVGSVGVLASGALNYFTGWMQADPAVSILIGVLVLYGSWGLVREGVDILMESVPRHIDLDEMRTDLLAVTGTEEVHDLHVWCLTTRQIALSAHAVVAADADRDRVLAEMCHLLQTKFDIHHLTLQLERDNRRQHEPEHF